MKIINLIVLGAVFVISGCAASYATPGGAARLSDLAEPEINELLAIEPAAKFPANISIARIQAPGYQSYSTSSYGNGRYSVVTTRDVETDADFARLTRLPDVIGIAPLNRILLPETLDSIKALREASARLRADIILIYTFDTSFQVGQQKFAPLNLIALGLLKNAEVTVTTTVSAAFYDVRTEFLYGLAEATAIESRNSSAWGKAAAVDDLRIETETEAFHNLIPEIENAWSGIVAQHSGGDS